jgi:hypothetical protein
LHIVGDYYEGDITLAEYKRYCIRSMVESIRKEEISMLGGDKDECKG